MSTRGVSVEVHERLRRQLAWSRDLSRLNLLARLRAEATYAVSCTAGAVRRAECLLQGRER